MQTTPQSVWRWKIAAYLFLAGMGAGTCIVGFSGDFMGYEVAAKIAVTFGVPVVALSTLFLISDLGHPGKFFMAILHPGKSWISRGFYILSGLIVFGGLTIVLWVWPFQSVLDQNRSLRTLLEIIACAFALGTCIYTGILIGVIVSRPFWNNPLLPVLFLISAVSTGIGALFFITPIVTSALRIDSASAAEYIARLKSVDLVLIAIEAIAVYLYLTMVFDRAPEAANMLLRGKLSGLFWGGFVTVGLLLPVLMEYFELTLIAGLILLIGGYLMRQLILAAGIRSPLIVRVPFRVRPGI